MANINIKNIYYMLSYAYQDLNLEGYVNIETEEFENVHDLLAHIIIKLVSRQIKQGLHRDYIPISDNVRNLKGKIDITSSIKAQTMISGKMVCNYDLFYENSLLNQIVKAAMKVLILHGGVSHDNRKALRKLYLYFSNVLEINPISINWSATKYDRNNATYKGLINLSSFIIKGLLLTTKEGSVRMKDSIDDQKMHKLYEKFVLGYFKKEHPKLNAKASYISWNLSEGVSSLNLPVMKSDVTLTYGDKTLIIDTKYYGKTMQTHSMFDSTSIISSNLYQIYTYVKNKDVDNSGNVSGLVLYAKPFSVGIPPTIFYALIMAHCQTP